MKIGITKTLIILLLVAAPELLADPLPPDCTDGASVGSMVGASCSVGGTIFSNFAYKVVGSGANLAPPATGVFIQFLTTGSGPGLAFTADPAWNLDGPGDGQHNNSYNAFIDFDVAAPQNFVFTAVGLSATGFDNLGSAGKVLETVSGGGNTYTVQVSGFSSETTTLSDSVTFDGLEQLHITKKIQLSNGNGQGNGFDSIGQSFTMVDPAPADAAAVPEPSVTFLIGSGLVALAVLRRARK